MISPPFRFSWRSPFRHAFQYSDGFLVEDRDKTFLHLDVAQTSVLVDGETKMTLPIGAPSDILLDIEGWS